MPLDAQGRIRLILERVETLASRVARDGALDEQDAVGWIIRLVKALEPIHALGVAHGAITAEALKIEGPSGGSRGLLADASRVRDLLAYHSPERGGGGPISPEDDTWAVAVTLYLALTGALPFPGADDREVQKRIAGAQPSPLAVFDVGDDVLQQILLRALQRDLEGRLTRVRDLREALEAWHPDPGAKQLPPLGDDDEPPAGSGVGPLPSEAKAHAVDERLTPVTAVDPSSSFAMPMEDDEDEATRVRPVALTEQQLQLMLSGATVSAPVAAPVAARSRGRRVWRGRSGCRRSLHHRRDRSLAISHRLRPGAGRRSRRRRRRSWPHHRRRWPHRQPLRPSRRCCRRVGR